MTFFYSKSISVLFPNIFYLLVKFDFLGFFEKGSGIVENSSEVFLTTVLKVNRNLQDFSAMALC